jgi:hypothetical protein
VSLPGGSQDSSDAGAPMIDPTTQQSLLSIAERLTFGTADPESVLAGCILYVLLSAIKTGTAHDLGIAVEAWSDRQLEILEAVERALQSSGKIQ